MAGGRGVGRGGGHDGHSGGRRLDRGWPVRSALLATQPIDPARPGTERLRQPRLACGKRRYASVAERHPEAAIVVPPRSTAVPSKTAESEPTQRDRHLRRIAEHGRMARQKASGYTERARAEAAIGRWKQVIGDGLRAHTDERRATEVDVAVLALNRMLELGRPSYVRFA